MIRAEKVSYWLVPAQDDRAPLSRTIADLAAQWNGPLFTPHVTIYSGSITRPARIHHALRKAAALFPPIALDCTGIATSDEFTKTLFLTFPQCPPLSALAETLRAEGSDGETYELHPHLSLMYARIDPAVNARISTSIALPAHVRFDTIQAVLTGRNNNTKADIEAWKVIGQEQLHGV